MTELIVAAAITALGSIAVAFINKRTAKPARRKRKRRQKPPLKREDS